MVFAVISFGRAGPLAMGSTGVRLRSERLWQKKAERQPPTAGVKDLPSGYCEEDFNELFFYRLKSHICCDADEYLSIRRNQDGGRDSRWASDLLNFSNSSNTTRNTINTMTSS
jgi:hypothetical protein